MSLSGQSYQDAVKQEQDHRDLAFCESSVSVCGIQCRLITPRIYALLTGCDNAFVCGGSPTMEHIASFLWICSTDFSREQKIQSEFVQKKIAPLSPEYAIEEIAQFIDMNFADAQNGGGTNYKAYTSYLAAIVDILAKEYGWRDEWIIDMPLMRIYQYMRRIQMRNNPGAIMFNRSDRVLSAALQRRNSANN